MDFFHVKERTAKTGAIEIFPDFKVGRSKDLMVRGKGFYAIWDQDRGLWSTDEYDVQRLVDKELMDYQERLLKKTEAAVSVKLMSDFSTQAWIQFRNYMSHISDNSVQLDTRLAFQNETIQKTDYVSKKLPYPLEKGSFEAYEELASTLYDKEERAKLEWAIGAIISGDAKNIQKFVVLYGAAGSGKSTMLDIIQRLFVGYYTTFEAKALTSANNSFSTESFKDNPLVAIQHDGDLSRIEDNTRLNSIVSHEQMTMNEKYKPSYMSRVNAFLFMATNKPVRITDGKSGLIRRLIDVRPSGNKVSTKRYNILMSQIDFELGAIASHCLKVYRKMGKNYYSGYRPLDMMLQTDVFYNFVESSFYVFKQQSNTTLSQAYDMYKAYCDESLVEFKLPKHKFREELKNYFESFSDVERIDGKQVRSIYSGFLESKFTAAPVEEQEPPPSSLVMDSMKSLIDDLYSGCLAQYAKDDELPGKKWSNVTTTLSSIDTTLLHYVKVPESHIVIDFDLVGDDKQKSLEDNIEAASKWPATYAELSKSGKGVHLHYIYEGDTSTLSRIFSQGIEIKVFNGDASLRRKLTKCNNIPVARINSGLPLKGVKMINADSVKSERGLRDLILRNLHKEIHPATGPSVDFIKKILDDAYESGITYDLTEMRSKILTFAMSSTNQADHCVKAVSQMKFKSEEKDDIQHVSEAYENDTIVFFDTEVFPNLFVVVWKFQGKDHTCVRMINPTPQDMETLFKMKLIGFNNRRYDNHILYARYLGYSNEELYKLSQKIISKSSNAMFREAYGISYADVLDFSSIKQGLKLFQIQLGDHHQELGYPWDLPVPEELWVKVADYCANDVTSLETVFDDRREDFIARKILSELSGLPVNDTTQMHTARIIFGRDQNAQDSFVYTDLSEMFHGYKFEGGVSTYQGFTAGEGGYVYAEPGMYKNVALLDVASMHPTSIECLNLFGTTYTKRFSELKRARIAIKHKDFDTAGSLMNGILKKYLGSKESAASLAAALKVIIVSVYGFTAAQYDSKFRDPRNKDNIVAKRGALFMIDLQLAVQTKGFTVAHIKTDSIKIPDATPEIIEFVFEFGAKYGYTFEHEATYSKFCLVNDAVYIAKSAEGEWTATGAQFAQPYVFKTLFSGEPIEFDDLCETKQVTTALYLDFNEDDPNTENLHFIGKAGLFCPMKPGTGGGLLLREKDGAYHAAVGTKGYRWMESEVVKVLGKEKDIDHSYYVKLVDAAVEKISTYGDFEWFTN